MSRSHLRKHIKHLILAVLGLLTVLVILYIAVISVGRWWVMRDMSAGEKAEYTVYSKKEWTFDEAELYPDPFTSQTLYAVAEIDYYYSSQQEIFKDVTWHISQYFDASPYVDTKKVSSADEIEMAVEPLLPTVELWGDLVGRPDYDFQALATCETEEITWNFGAPLPKYEIARALYSILSFQSERSISAGNSKKVLQDAESILAGSRLPSYFHTITLLNGIMIRSGFYPVWSRAVSETEDVEVLKQFLEWQNHYGYADDLITSGTGQQVVDYASGVRLIARFGHHIDIQNMTAEELFARYSHMGTDYLEYAILPGLSGTERSEVGSYIRARRAKETPFIKTVMIPEPFRENPFLRKLAEPVLSPFIYNLMVLQYNEAPIRFLNSQSAAMLLKMETAARIFELEEGRRPALQDALAGLVSDGGVKGYEDFSMVGGRFYYFGPDGKDDGMRVSYDPTNGVGSSGDIFFDPESPFDRFNQ